MTDKFDAHHIGVLMLIARRDEVLRTSSWEVRSKLPDRISLCDCGYSTTIFGFTRHQHDILGDLPVTPA